MKRILFTLLSLCLAVSAQEKSPAKKFKGTRTLLPGHVSRLVTLGADGKDLRTVYETDKEIIEAPNWSPDGKWLVFNGSSALWRVPADGSAKPVRIPTGNVQLINNDHLLSPDGKTIYFSAGGHLYSVAFEGGEPRRISNEHPEESKLSYWLHGISPDGKTLAYTGARKIGDDPWALVDIYTIPSTGGPDVNLTKSPPYDDGPEFSPDGKWIYFNSERDAKKRGESQNYRMAEAQIYRMRPDGSGIEQLTRDDRVNWFPHLSPDGQWMVYLSFPPLTLGHPADKPIILRRMKPGGAESIDLIAFNGGQGTINVPSWSPDSKRFAFVMYPAVGANAAGPKPFAKEVFRDEFAAPELGKAWSSWMSASAVKDGVLVGARIEAEKKISVNSFLVPPARDLEIALSFRLEGGSFAIVVDDSTYDGSHSGHLSKILVKADSVYFEDMKTGSNKNEIQAMKGNFDEATKALLKTKEKTVPVSVAEKTTHQLVVRLEGNTLTASIDGREVGSFAGEGFSHATKDRVCLWTMKNSVHFDDVVVRVP